MVPVLTGRVEAALQGWPAGVLSGLLVVLGIGLIVAGLRLQSPVSKAALAAWVLMP